MAACSDRRERGHRQIDMTPLRRFVDFGADLKKRLE
jgi:hypothetical protein